MDMICRCDGTALLRLGDDEGGDFVVGSDVHDAAAGVRWHEAIGRGEAAPRADVASGGCIDLINLAA